MGKKNTINGGLVRWENRPTQWKVFQQAVPGGNWNIQAEQAEHVDQVRVDWNDGFVQTNTSSDGAAVVLDIPIYGDIVVCAVVLWYSINSWQQSCLAEMQPPTLGIFARQTWGLTQKIGM